MTKKTSTTKVSPKRSASRLLVSPELKAQHKRLVQLRAEAAQIEADMLGELIEQSMCEERYTEMFQLLLEISKTSKSRDIRRKCLLLLKSSDDVIVERVAKKYRVQGINACIAVSEKKIRQARELDADVTAVTGEVYVAEFEELKQSV